MGTLSTEKVSDQLVEYIEREEYKGFDPYDTLNSFLPFGIIGKWGKPIAIQIQKRNPINLRPLMGIKKGYNPKAMGLLLQAYCLRYKRTQNPDCLERADWLFGWLINNYSKGFSGYCWGYNFDWASSVKLLPAYSPTIVVSGFIAKGIRAYYELTAKPKALEVLVSIGEFMDKDLAKSEDDSGICISYSTIEADCCYNASMLGAEHFAFLYTQTQEKKYKELAISCSRFVASKQLNSGCWNYSINLETRKERKQVDFHQGYVLDSLSYVCHYIPDVASEFKTAIEKGTDFYAKMQFNHEGRSYYRIPSQWPVEIHNQAQGIISFSRWGKLNEEFKLAQSILEYSVTNMRSSKGFFFYKKYPWITIKIPFMRWSQAWMLLALEEFLNSKETGK